MVPQLRPDLQTFVDPRGLIVYDPHTGHRVLLGPESTTLWNALSAGHLNPSILAHATPELSDSQRYVRLLQLDQALLLMSPRWRRQEHLFHSRGKAVESPLYVHPRLVHQCVKCGGSCQEVHVGPVTSLTLATMRREELWKHVGGQNLDDLTFQVQLPDKNILMMKQVDQHCIVWTPEKNCLIHSYASQKLKPSACQQYPYTLTKARNGVYVGLQLSCRSLAQSLKAAANVRPTEIAQFLAPIVNMGGQTQTLPAPAPLSAGVFVPDASVETWWKWAIKQVETAITELEEKKQEYIGQNEWIKPWHILNQYVHEWLKRMDEGEEYEWIDSKTWLHASSLPTKTEVKNSFADDFQQAIQETMFFHQKEGRWQEMKRLEVIYDAIEVWASRWTLKPLRFRGNGGPYLFYLAVLEAVYSHKMFLSGDLILGLALTRLYLEIAEALLQLQNNISAKLVTEESDVNDAFVTCYRAFNEPIIENFFKRWAGGIRWMMSPLDQYHYSLGTLEPHLFRYLNLSAKAQMSVVEQSVQEGEKLAGEILKQTVQDLKPTEKNQEKTDKTES
jgi:Fe-S-cluster containining protein